MRAPTPFAPQLRQLKPLKCVVATASGNIGKGTFVTIAAGNIVDVATSASANAMYAIVQGVRDSSGNAIVDAAPYIASGGSGIAEVVPLTEDIFVSICAYTASATSAAPGQYIDLKSNGVNTSTGLSTACVDDANIDTGATRQFQIIDKVDRPDNDWGDHQMELIVRLNLNQRVQVRS